MYFSKLVFILISSFLAVCNHSSSFDREVWIDNPDVNDTSSPRASMVQDVMENHLKPGMSRKAVLDLLGEPFQEKIERRLSKNTILPGSVSFTNDENLNPENS